ncbi:MAG: CHASE2 domain-containing protein [Pacificimonas sp.]
MGQDERADARDANGLNDGHGQRRLVILVLLLFLLLMVVRLFDMSPLRTLREAAFAPLQDAQGEDIGLGRVTIIAIDERSLVSEGQWPWPRDRMARLVETMAAAEPAAIGLGFLMSEADRLSPANDQALAAAMRGAPVVLATAAAPVLSRERERSLKLVEPTLALRETASGFGMISTLPERDGHVRSMPAKLSLDGVTYPAFGMELARVATEVPAMITRNNLLDGRRIMLGDISVSPDRRGAVWMRFAPGDLVDQISAAKLLAEPALAGGLKDRVVIVGPTAAGLTGLSLSPQSDTLVDMELQSIFVANLLSESFLSRPMWIALMEGVMAALLSFALLSFYLRRRPLGPVGTGSAIIAIILALGALSWLLAASADLLLDWTLPALALLLTAAAMTVHWRHNLRGHRRAREQDRVTAMLMVRTSENARRNFYQNLSHELRTPLNMIVAGAEMIRDGVLGPVKPPEYTRYADDIHGAGVQITRMFERMIDLGSASVDRVRMEESPFPLRVALDHALLATGAPRAFHLDLPRPMPSCLGDRKMIEIALANVAENALKFRAGSAAIMVEAARRAGRFEISIEDDGPGLSPEQIAVIGQLHVDGNIQAARKTRGLGLGLALTRSILELHGGGIEVQAGRSGAYSRLVLRIPSARLIW